VDVDRRAGAIARGAVRRRHNTAARDVGEGRTAVTTARAGRAAVAAAIGLTGLAACGARTIVITALPAAPAPATPSTASPSGAMWGFLGAAAAQANDKVTSWLATPADSTDLAALLRVYGNFGSGGQGGLYWAVAGVRVLSVTAVDATHADVLLTSDIVYCLGRAANDPAATCAAVQGAGGAGHAYTAILADSAWRVDVDVDSSTQLDHNPQASPVASTPAPASPSASPAPT
jgi:hypothetical protein